MTAKETISDRDKVRLRKMKGNVYLYMTFPEKILFWVNSSKRRLVTIVTDKRSHKVEYGRLSEYLNYFMGPIEEGDDKKNRIEKQFSKLNEKIAANMKRYRKLENLLQYQVADKFDLKLGTYQAYEEARARPPIEILLKVKQLYKLRTIEDIIV